MTSQDGVPAAGQGRYTVLSGGVGGARFLLGVRHLLGTPQFGDGSQSDNELTAVVNVGDDAWMLAGSPGAPIPETAGRA